MTYAEQLTGTERGRYVFEAVREKLSRRRLNGRAPSHAELRVHPDAFEALNTFLRTTTMWAHENTPSETAAFNNRDWPRSWSESPHETHEEIRLVLDGWTTLIRNDGRNESIEVLDTLDKYS